MKTTDYKAVTEAPCFHCGNTNCEVQSEIDISGSWANVHCGNCQSHGPTITAPRLAHLHEIAGLRERIEAEAITAWNHRPELEEARKARDLAEASARWINGIKACNSVAELVTKLPPDILMAPMPFPDRLDYAGKMIQAAFEKWKATP